MRIVFTTTVPFVKSVEHEAHRLLQRCFYPNAGTIELFKGSTAKMIRAVRRAEREHLPPRLAGGVQPIDPGESVRTEASAWQ